MLFDPLDHLPPPATLQEEATGLDRREYVLFEDVLCVICALRSVV